MQRLMGSWCWVYSEFYDKKVKEEKIILLKDAVREQANAKINEETWKEIIYRDRKIDRRFKNFLVEFIAELLGVETYIWKDITVIGVKVWIEG